VNRRGFSLVEMMAALVIFSVGVVGTLHVFSLSVVSAGTSVHYNKAVFLAQGLLEEKLAEEDWSLGEDSGGLEAQLPEGQWTSRVLSTDTEGLYEVEISVAWTERGKQDEYTLTTFAAER
jgi:prepilin-type N-terminal cleavage/methylation domain-containing protein